MSAIESLIVPKSRKRSVKYDVVLSVVDYKGTPLVWIMDYSSFHMSPNRDWFVAYEEFDSGHVFMDLKKILISLGVLDSNGFIYTSESDVLRVLNVALVVMKASKATSSLYTLQGMIILSKRGLLDNHKVSNLEFCEHSVIKKQKRVSFSKAIHQTKATLDYLHSVCWGPSRVSSLGGARYILLIVDDFSRVTWVFLMKPKSEAFEKFKRWKILIENQTGRKIKRLHTDNAERINITLLERTRRLLLSVGLDRSFWAEALNMACYLINRSPATAIDCKTPIEVWCGKPVDYSKLYVFGCPTYYHVSEDPAESKLEEDALKQVEHVVSGLANHDVTSPHDQSNSPHLEHDQYRSIAHDRPRKNTKAPSRFGFEDYVAYALQVVEEVESLEPATYRDAITFKESDMLTHHVLELEQLDAKTAFLHSDLEVEIYMRQPEGFVVQGKEDYVCKLQKSLYGLKQSPRQCAGSLIYLLLYVDDMLAVAKDIEEVNMLKILLNTKFDMNNLRAAQKILGMEIIRDEKDGKAFLITKNYTDMIISRFGMSSAKSVNTPSSTNFRLSVAYAPHRKVEIEYMS
nr:hypothetical protein [Tanacetum cinerariifolium]